MAIQEDTAQGDARARETIPKVVAVVLTWNDFEMAGDCIETVLASRYASLETVLVDNGSSFPTVAPLRERFPTVEMVALSENFGFTGGCNRGMEKALEMGADYVFLLNNDTLVHEDAVSELVTVLEADREVGMASALLIFPGEDRRIQSYRGYINRDAAYISRPEESAVAAGEYKETKEAEFVSACALLFRAEALRKVGLFDETLFTNWEDYDLCIRFQDAGYKILVVGGAEVIHKHHQTTGATSPFITYLSVRNRLILLKRYGTLGGIVRNLPGILKSLYGQVREYGFDNVECHRAFAKGIFHFLLGVRGKGGTPSNRSDKSTGTK